MAIIWRKRKTGTTDTEAPALPALSAAAAPVPPDRWGKITKPANGARGDWQAEAWDMLDLVGELSFALLWKTALLSRFRLVASDLDPETGKPTGSTDNELAKQIVRAIAGGATGQSQLLSRLAPLMMIPGEAWLAIIYPGGEEQWHILSRDEVKTRGDKVELELEDGTKYEVQPDTDTLSRIWRRDPRRSVLPWSPVKAALPILRQIVRMTQNVEAAGKSRQAGNGVLVLPREISMPTTEPPRGESPDAPNLPPPPPAAGRFVSAGELRQALQAAMSKAIEDPSSAEALVPIIITVAGEYVDKIRHIKFDSEVSEKALAALEKAVRRLAMTLDMPPEVLLGLADLNHWSLAGVEEEGVRWHAAPEMEVICDAFTTQLLRPLLPPGTEVVVWYDTSDVDAEPDGVEKTRQAFMDGVARPTTYLQQLGLSQDTDGYDLSTRDGWRDWATDTIRRKPELLPVLAPVLRTLVPALGDLPELAPAPPTSGPPPEPPAIDTSRQPDTREAAAATMLRMSVNEALRLAGKRRRTRQDQGRLRDVPARDTHLHLRCAAADIDRLITGWDEVLDEELCVQLGINRARLAAAVTEISRAALTSQSRPVVPVAVVRQVLT
ncbi:hypothetical protein [Nocardia farcinica]|uniref:hypothetical protein n=1 Tax=Nocardia farcinica TaxID=37329 RepID=UPI001E5AFA4A|nr:hypothetical protein [Nocardia farcinica]UEX21196.1 hypothetical protein LMJ57_19540 [Nocardia farcinica]